jgi:hypothetical protein
VTGVGLLEDGVTQNNLFELLDGCCTVGGPDKGYILLCQFCQGFRNVGEIVDKGSLIAKDAECASNLFDSSKLFGPSGQAVPFRWVDANGAITDNNT